MKLTEYVRDVRGEMKHVNWPAKGQAWNYTLLVIGISIAVALILAAADYIFGIGLEKLLLQ